jgi:peptidoglycan hydrolase-like protein with peptidoglycan-binding domain
LIRWIKKSKGWLVIPILPTLLLATYDLAQVNTTEPGKSSTAKKRVAPQGAKVKPRSHHRKTSRRRKRQSGFKYRLAQLHLQPERVTEIQQALAQAGYLHEEPSGQWDDQTREAMQRYQADNRFPTTGLPEAKSLMKLGLGPHPLPPALDPSVHSGAGVDPSAKPSYAAPLQPRGKPDSSTPPNQEQ